MPHMCLFLINLTLHHIEKMPQWQTLEELLMHLQERHNERLHRCVTEDVYWAFGLTEDVRWALGDLTIKP